MLFQVAAGLAAVAALWKWMPREPMAAGLATATASFLVLPYAFNYDMTVVGVAALLALHGAAERPGFVRIGALLAFLLPLLVVNLNNAGLPAGPAVLTLLLAAQLRQGREGTRPRSGALATA